MNAAAPGAESLARLFSEADAGASVEPDALLEACLARTEPLLGRAGQREWRRRATAALFDPTTGAGRVAVIEAPAPCAAVARTWNEFLRAFAPARLVAERDDQELRDRAVAACAERLTRGGRNARGAEDEYLARWSARIRRLLRAGCGRRRLAVRGLPRVEVHGWLMLALVEALRDPGRFAPHEAAGVEATLRMISRTRDSLRRRAWERMALEEGADLEASGAPSPEEHYEAAENAARARAELAAMVTRLTAVQRRWLDTARAQVEDGPWEGRLNGAAAAITLGRSRMEASRQFARLRAALREARAANEALGRRRA